MLKKLILTLCLCLVSVGVTFTQDQSSKGGTIGGTDLTITGATGPSAIYSLAGNTNLAVQGSDQSCDDGDRHFTEIYIPYKMEVTGIFYLIGSVGGTDSVSVELFDSDGTLVIGATSENANGVKYGAIVGSSTTWQKCPFTSGVVTVTPGRYFISATFSGTTAKFRSPTVATGVGIIDEDTGTAHTPASITPGTAFVADKGIIGGIY